MRAIEIHVEAVPRRVQVDLEAARLISNDTAYAGDTILVEATLRPWQQPARNVRFPSPSRPGSPPETCACWCRMRARWTGP